MRRRRFIALLAGVTAAWPDIVCAQSGDRMRRVGILLFQASTDPDQQRRFGALVDALRHLGWTEGGNVRIDTRWAAGDVDRARALARELVGLSPDVIFSASTVSLTAVREATLTIPVVFATIADPIGQGFVSNLARPGGNLTGFAAFDPNMGSKWLELLKQIAPATQRAVLLFNPKTGPYNASVLRVMESAAPSFAVRVAAAPVHGARDIEDAITTLAREPDGGLIVGSDAFALFHRELITTLVARHRIPAVYPLPDFATIGGLLCYGVDLVEQYRQGAGYIDRILKGAKPADLPVQAPTKFELIVNLKTARALGITIPPSLLARADEVIE